MPVLIDKTQREQGQTVYPEIVIDSVNMTLHDRALVEKDYDRLADYLIESIENLRAAGAEIAAITANTEHIIWDMVCQRFTLPVVSVVDATINEIKKKPGDVSVQVINTTLIHIEEIYKSANN